MVGHSYGKRGFGEGDFERHGGNLPWLERKMPDCVENNKYKPMTRPAVTVNLHISPVPADSLKVLGHFNKS